MIMRTSSLDHLIGCIGETVSSIGQDVQEEFIDSLLSAEKVFIYGSGRSGLVGQLFAVRLVQIGLDVHFVGDMTTPIIGRNDLTVLVSNTGETMSAVQTANIARRIGSKVVSVTGNPSSKLAHASNLVIPVIHRSENDALYAPLGTVFEDSVCIFFDSIVPCIMKKKGITEEDMRRRHAIWV